MELRRVGILIMLKQQTPSLRAVGCAGSGGRGCGGGRRQEREENGLNWKIGMGKSMRRRGGKRNEKKRDENEGRDKRRKVRKRKGRKRRKRERKGEKKGYGEDEEEDRVGGQGPER